MWNDEIERSVQWSRCVYSSGISRLKKYIRRISGKSSAIGNSWLDEWRTHRHAKLWFFICDYVLANTTCWERDKAIYVICARYISDKCSRWELFAETPVCWIRMKISAEYKRKWERPWIWMSHRHFSLTYSEWFQYWPWNILYTFLVRGTTGLVYRYTLNS